MGSAVGPVISTVEELEALLGRPAERALNKERSRLTDIDRAWLAGSLVQVLDDATIARAERPGNRRLDGYRNVLGNPHGGLVPVMPGRGDTLRVDYDRGLYR